MLQKLVSSLKPVVWACFGCFQGRRLFFSTRPSLVVARNSSTPPPRAKQLVRREVDAIRSLRVETTRCLLESSKDPKGALPQFSCVGRVGIPAMWPDGPVGDRLAIFSIAKVLCTMMESLESNTATPIFQRSNGGISLESQMDG